MPTTARMTIGASANPAMVGGMRARDIGPYKPNSYVVGDARELLHQLPDKSIDCVVTSPPYWGLRSYLPDGHPSKTMELGCERTFQEYVEHMVEVFREVRRALKPAGTLWLNLGDCYATGAGARWRLPRGRSAGGTMEGHGADDPT